MSTSVAPLARAIGARVRRQRKARDWTLDDLARAASVSRRMVVSIEQGSVNPSVGVLLRLSDALGIGLPELVERPASRSPQVTRSGAGAVLWSGDHGGRGTLVAGTEAPDVVELWDWRLAPGERHDSEAHAAGTRELLHVLEGAATLTVGDEVIELAAGDTVGFHGDVAHSYANPGALPARFSLAVFEPGVGTEAHSEGGHA